MNQSALHARNALSEVGKLIILNKLVNVAPSCFSCVDLFLVVSPFGVMVWDLSTPNRMTAGAFLKDLVSSGGE